MLTIEYCVLPCFPHGYDSLTMKSMRFFPWIPTFRRMDESMRRMMPWGDWLHENRPLGSNSADSKICFLKHSKILEVIFKLRGKHENI